MVRLKDARLRSLVVAKVISIPYGAIKSNYYVDKIYYLVEFQFLMVRLKGLTGTMGLLGLEKFQFLMVRLKATTAIRRT